jgi:hypothetical protein
VALDDFLADGQSDAGPVELFPFVQPLEHAKNPLEVLRLNSQSVVLHRKYPFGPGIAGSGNMHFWDSRTLVLDGIADQVLKQLN